MKLSIVMPSHNVGTGVYSNILNASTFGGDDVEVIIRDNSGNLQKRDFLSHIKENNCRVISVDECPGAENAERALDQAKGEFVFVICDDDYTNGNAILAILAEIDRIKDDRKIIGTTGIFIFDDKTKSQFICYNHLNGVEPVERVQSFLGSGTPSIFQFSPMRRSVLQDVWSFASTLPVYLSYHDWLMNCLFLVHGRLTYIERHIYHYFNTNWTTDDSVLKTDADYFRRAGLDSSGVRLQWLIAIYEGAQTFLKKYQRADLMPSQRERLAAIWTAKWFPQFSKNAHSRVAEDARFDEQAMRLVEKWRIAKDIKFDEISSDLSEYFALSSPSIAERYYKFWK